MGYGPALAASVVVAGDPDPAPPPSGDPCAALRAELTQALHERDTARAQLALLISAVRAALEGSVTRGG